MGIIAGSNRSANYGDERWFFMLQVDKKSDCLWIEWMTILHAVDWDMDNTPGSYSDMCVVDTLYSRSVNMLIWMIKWQ